MEVKPKRAYNSTRRKAQAETTKRNILEAATRLFVQDGYVASTIEAIAVEADVSAKTIYDSFATKAGLLRGVWDLALKGDTAAPVDELPRYRALFEEPDARAAVALLAHNSVEVKKRIGSVFQVIGSAAALDADSAELRALINRDFHANQRAFVEHLHKRKALRPGLSVRKAADVLWTYNHPEVWLLLHVEQGWSAREFERWLDESVAAALLPGE